MPKIISDVLREGLGSTIYLIGFSGPYTGYGLAKMYYGIGKQTGRMYPILKKLKRVGAVEYKNGYFSSVNPLLRELRKTKEMLNFPPNKRQERFLKLFLDSRFFRDNFFKIDYLEKSLGRHNGILNETDSINYILQRMFFSILFATYCYTVILPIDKDDVLEKMWMRVKDYDKIESFDEAIKRIKEKLKGVRIAQEQFEIFSLSFCIPLEILLLFRTPLSGIYPISYPKGSSKSNFVARHASLLHINLPIQVKEIYDQLKAATKS